MKKNQEFYIIKIIKNYIMKKNLKIYITKITRKYHFLKIKNVSS